MNVIESPQFYSLIDTEIQHTVSKSMVKYASGISLESVVDVEVSVTVPDAPIQSATVRNLELNIHEIHVISRAMELPFLVEDAGRRLVVSTAVHCCTIDFFFHYCKPY